MKHPPAIKLTATPTLALDLGLSWLGTQPRDAILP